MFQIQEAEKEFEINCSFTRNDLEAKLKVDFKFSFTARQMAAIHCAEQLISKPGVIVPLEKIFPKDYSVIINTLNEAYGIAKRLGIKYELNMP